jgi:hypothetical protein
MVALGTAHDALLTRCRATLPGPATRSTSSALDERGSFPEPGWGKLDRRGAAHQAFALATLIFRDRRWWIRKSTSTAAQDPGSSAGAQKAQCDDAEARSLVSHHSATRVSVRSARSHTHSEKRFPRICAGLVRIASSSKASTTVKPAAMLKTRIGDARSPSA